jgi:hypothetical protein
MAVHGTRRRESVSWDYAGLLQLLGNLAVERTRLPLLRCYWYEATVEGRRSADHDTLADLPGVKLRVAKMRPGRREGVEGEIHRDLTTLARNKAVSDVMVVSAEEDLAQVITDVQDMGMRVTLLYISDDGSREISRALRQECDDIVEISAAQLRPFVELISGAEPPRPDEADAAQAAQRPAVNGIGVNGNGMNGNGMNGNGRPAARSAGYPQPQPQPSARPTVSPVPQPAVTETPPDPGQQERAEAPAPDYAPSADYALSADYGASADYSPAAEHANPVDYGAAPDYSSAPEYAAPLPAPVPVPVPVPPREDIYAAPVALPASAEDLPGDRVPGRPRNDLAAYNAGAGREPYQRESMLREPGDAGDRLQPVPVALPGTGSAQIRRLPARGPVPGGPGPGQPLPGLPPAVADAGIGQQPGGQPPNGPQPSGQPTGSQPVAPVAPVVPMDPNAMGYAPGRGGAPGITRHAIQGPNPNSGPQPVIGPVGGGPQLPPVTQAQQIPPTPSIPGGQVPGGQQVPGNQQIPGGQPEIGGQPGPIGLVGPGGYPGAPPAPAPAPAPAAAPGVSLADAVQSAHEEGQAFGESVARDAPALWLEAVLARKPRMPSDLEARLLQGSALPIDFLLHDEVRHALRRGFWDALERARR